MTEDPPSLIHFQKKILIPFLNDLEKYHETECESVLLRFRGKGDHTSHFNKKNRNLDVIINVEVINKQLKELKLDKKTYWFNFFCECLYIVASALTRNSNFAEEFVAYWVNQKNSEDVAYIR